MNYDVWFSENIEPAFTDENKEAYRPLVAMQFFPLGNQIEGRQLLRCNTPDFGAVAYYLNSLGKQVIICGMRKENGDWVGEKNQVEFDKFMQPVDGETPLDNCTAGWLPFNN